MSEFSEKWKSHYKTRNTTTGQTESQAKSSSFAQSWTSHFKKNQSALFADDEQIASISDAYKQKWNYDYMDAEDMQRQAQGIMPKSSEKTYSDSEVDQWLKANNLPAYSKLESYVQSYYKDKEEKDAKVRATSSAKQKIISSWNDILAEKGALSEDDAAEAYWKVAGSSEYADYLDSFKAEHDVFDEDREYDTEAAQMEARTKFKSKDKEDDIFFRDMFNEATAELKAQQEAVEAEKKKHQIAVDAWANTVNRTYEEYFKDTVGQAEEGMASSLKAASAALKNKGMTATEKAELRLIEQGLTDEEIDEAFIAAGRADDRDIAGKAQKEAARKEREAGENATVNAYLESLKENADAEAVKTVKRIMNAPEETGATVEFDNSLSGFERIKSAYSDVMPNLDRAVNTLREQGYTDEQITAAFIAAGYQGEIEDTDAGHNTAKAFAQTMIQNGASDLEAYNAMARNRLRVDSASHTIAAYSNAMMELGWSAEQVEAELMSMTDDEKRLMLGQYTLDPSIQTSKDKQILMTAASIPIRAALSIASSVVGFVDLITPEMIGDAAKLGEASKWLADASAKMKAFGSDANTPVLNIMGDVGSELLRMYATSLAGAALAGASGVSAAASSASSTGLKALLKKAISVESIPFLASSMGGYYAEATVAGASSREATLYALVAGTGEGALEALGTSEMFGKALSKGIANKLIKNGSSWISSELAMKGAGMLVSAVGEGIEEGASYTLSGYMQKATFNPEWEFNANEFWESAGMGALIGIFGSAATSGGFAGEVYTNVFKKYEEMGIITAEDIDALNAAVEVENMPQAKQRTTEGVMLDLDTFQSESAAVAKAITNIENARVSHAERVKFLDTELNEANKAYLKAKEIYELIATDPNADSASLLTASREFKSAKRSWNKAKDSYDSKLAQANKELESVTNNQTELMNASNAKLDSHWLALDAQNRAVFAQKALNDTSERIAATEAEITRLGNELMAATDPTVQAELGAQYDALVAENQLLQDKFNTDVHTSEWMNMEYAAQRGAWDATEAARIEALAKNQEVSARVQEIKEAVSTHQDWQQVQELAKQIGVNVVAVEDLVAGKNGLYKNGVIYISNKSTDPAMVVFKHELTHYIESSKFYKDFSRFVRDELNEAGVNVNALIVGVQNEYAERGEQIDRTNAMREVVASYVQSRLFENQKSIDTLVKMQNHSAKLIYNWIVSQIQKFGQNKQTRSLIEAERLFRNAFADAGQVDITADTASVETPTSVGQASYGLNIDDLIAKYGTVPKGANPVRDVSIPAQIDNDTRTSRFVQNVMESKAATETFVAEAKERLIDGLGAYQPISDASAMARATNVIANSGLEAASKRWESVVNGRKRADKYDIALGEQLLTEYINAGDSEVAMQMVAELCAEATRAGQVTQAFSLLKKMTPQGALYYTQKAIDNINKDFQARIDKGKMKPITLSQDLIDAFMSAQSAADIQSLYDEAAIEIGRQLPSTIADKITAWRYMAMLGNPRTHLRNILGNTIMLGAREAKTGVGAVLERVFLPEDQRTKAIAPTKEQRAFALDTWSEAEALMQGGREGFDDAIRRERRVFNWKLLEKGRKGNSNLLEKEDTFFMKRAYVNAFAQEMKAKGLTAETMTAKQRSEIMNHAVIEAQKATFHDTSKVANLLNQIESQNVATKLLVGGVLPFKKTPINILKRGVEYSPLGLVKGTAELIMRAKNGKIPASQVIDSFASGITGTGLFALGALLAKHGILRGGGEDEENYEYYQSDMGEQKYSLNVGDISFTLDWMSPIAIPLFAGVALVEATEGETLNFGDTIDALAKIADPLTEMSLLQGVNDTLESLAFADTVGGKIGVLATSAVQSYTSQFVPTALGQVARIIDDTRRTTSGDPNAALGSGVDKAVNKVIAKIPGASFSLPAYVDKFGQEQTDSWYLRILENTILPGYVSKKNVSYVNEELGRLYLAVGDIDIIPTRPNRSITKDGITYNMTNEEYEQYQKDVGQAVYQAIELELGGTSYDAWDDAKRAEEIVAAIKKAEKAVLKEYKKKFSDKFKGGN